MPNWPQIPNNEESNLNFCFALMGELFRLNQNSIDFWVNVFYLINYEVTNPRSLGSKKVCDITFMRIHENRTNLCAEYISSF